MENDLYWKRDYLVKTLSRTRRKDYENYVVNAIWNRLHSLDIQPVTQQCVHFEDGTYALIDLFFPQVAIGIECDEKYHQKNKWSDLERAEKIEDILSAYQSTSDFQLYRIDVSQTIEQIEGQIEDVVQHILTAYETNPRPWLSYHEELSQIESKGYLTINDTLRFRTIADICNCIGHECRGMQRSNIAIGANYRLWCPKLAIPHGEKLIAASAKGWINTISEDWMQIKESNPTKADIVSKDRGKKRITFVKSKDPLGQDGYRFVGVFQFIAHEHGHNIYRRVNDKIIFSEVIK